jgi:hypothetical protein
MAKKAAEAKVKADAINVFPSNEDHDDSWEYDFTELPDENESS